MCAVRQYPLDQSPILRQSSNRLTIQTNGHGLWNMTDPICSWVCENGFVSGLLTVFCPHTSAAVILQENTDPDVHDDLLDALESLAPRSVSHRHHIEGPDDMPAHIKTALTASSLTIPVMEGRPALGMWQAIYLAEFRDRPRERNLLMHCIGI